MELALVRTGKGLMRARAEEGLDLATIERCRRRDDEAFGHVVDAYQARVFGFVRRMLPSGEDAEDVTQEVFLKAYRNFPHFDGRSSLRTWLFRIAHNLCIDRARRRSRIPESGSLDAETSEGSTFEIADDRPDPERLAMTEELRQAVEAALEALSEKLRAVIILHDREELGYPEIAATLGVPLGTVKSRLFLARRELQRLLKEHLDD